jgi:alkanesulfonate monooxygenase SsuD/methylene tetrahydromethanopterin reductase-like flavin-dependent oxidoreductase (luciferase family)
MEFGVNLNNREPLITSDYTLADLLDLAELAEQRGFGSVWVGDSLFSKPRYEPISLLSAISQRTSRARLGTACLDGVCHNVSLQILDTGEYIVKDGVWQL